MTLQVQDYKKIIEIPSQHSIQSDEVQHLSWLGSLVPDNAIIVEIGTFRGTGTIAMALGARKNNKNFTVYDIDIWMRGIGTCGPLYYGVQTFKDYINNLMRFNLMTQVIPIMAFSSEAYAFWKLPIDLLFIDADHKYAPVHYDATRWGGRVKIGGRIAFHDYGGKFPGVKNVTEELLATKQWDDIHRVNSIWSARKMSCN
jgi:hypothetical protein